MVKYGCNKRKTQLIINIAINVYFQHESFKNLTFQQKFFKQDVKKKN